VVGEGPTDVLACPKHDAWRGMRMHAALSDCPLLHALAVRAVSICRLAAVCVCMRGCVGVGAWTGRERRVHDAGVEGVCRCVCRCAGCWTQELSVLPTRKHKVGPREPAAKAALVHRRRFSARRHQSGRLLCACALLTAIGARHRPFSPKGDGR
jgi:hypothetical protein